MADRTRRSETVFNIGRAKGYCDRAISATNASDYALVDSMCESAIFALKDAQDVNSDKSFRDNPRRGRKSKYRVRNNFKKYSKRRRVSHRRKSRRGKR